MVARPVRWSHSVGTAPRTCAEHAASFAQRITRRVRLRRPSEDPADVVAKELEQILGLAFEAGRRHGAARAQLDMESALNAQLERALRGIKLESPRCPHCAGRGCEACGDTGRFQP